MYPRKMYTPFRYTSKKYRPFSRRSAPVRQVKNRPPVKRKLFATSENSKWRTLTLGELQSSEAYEVSANSCVASYISYPELGDGGRHQTYFKIIKSVFSGSVLFKNDSSAYMDGGAGNGIHGIFAHVVVQDRKPRKYKTEEPLHSFADLFGSVAGISAELVLEERHRDRFRVLKQRKWTVNTAMDTYVMPLKGDCRISNNVRYPFWVSMKDDDGPAHGSGQYTNVQRNALLVYYAFISDNPCKAKLYFNYLTTFVC
ncbi:nuclear shuttling protein [Ocimum yellow vein virus]|uniref:Nuclear shuttle protein n=1 Tax=Ocimum yellow vein virus TaxID=2664942 RepID=A0A5Q0TSA6_9GEMI|nr:nuclear shuttling protein [Ocimum yellow vein virus]QGA69855.1 nuclear shuttling protein [Ocimum yellow vein virus]